ncbi:DEAD/DEAH box helicase [Falsiroseomonas sp. E2-1-a20]|uniref:DEAD/DEAH box helicase n=1 Tax=Falsiroseomonas sp. E2-1-a20 TaxID=3239300 RepID=UPI003F2FB530
MSLRDLLEKYRAGSSSEREKGTYFERLVKVWLEHAPTQRAQFSRVLMFSDWAKENGFDQRDTGIDLVAQLADSADDWCAIQCKFYAEGHRIQKADIDSFFTASGKRPFTRRMIVDTTGVQWSEHADEALRNQIVETIRVGLSDLEDSGIDWEAFATSQSVKLLDKKRPRQHQIEALAAVRGGFAIADRGKMIMACGTGKTYTALHIAEQMVGKGGRVLFLVPSLSLMSQSIREWSIDANIPLRSFAVCSDSQVGVRKAADGDVADIDVHDLEIPATTHGTTIAAKATPAAPDAMTVVFSTYQSIQAVSAAQLIYGLPAFDLIICDEAHRTTGVKLADEEESNFIRVHDAAYIRGKKRLYMTATPRIFGDAVKRTADDADAVLCSMDDPKLFGETLFTRNFSWAVQNGLLTDYKVIVLAVDEEAVSAGVQRLLADENSELKLDDATKIVGCYKALTKADLKTDVAGDTGPMRRALAFARDIKRSKLIETEFARVASEWRDTLDDDVAATIPALAVDIKHVDGQFSAHARNERLAWLKDTRAEADTCRILTNARCLSEGVDVPALDAILFLHPRKSQIDVVQSVGRVMRRAEGKKMGYVILPVAVPAGKAPEEALDDNEKYRVVWQILNALRAHDDRLDATINKIDLGVDPGDRIEIVAVTNEMPIRSEPKRTEIDVGTGGRAGDDELGDDASKPPRRGDGGQLDFQFDEFAKAIMARIVKKCGTRTYWETWATDIAHIAEVHVTRIRAAVQARGSQERNAFETFLAEIRDDLNDSITDEEGIEMLAQHLITRPVFDALFEGYSFAANNPVSTALQGVLDVLDRQHLEKEAEALNKFYASVRMRAQGIEDATAKQKIIVELYDKFFKAAFPKLSARLGIVYTPVEVVDFIIHSVDEVLQSEFGQTLGSEGVHIIDPFVGTGTFITRLLQSGLIKPEQMTHKYRHEIHANEIVLLAYYIAAINIEAVYHEKVGGEYDPFPGICLTDTFQIYEQERDLVSDMMTVNSSRRTRQKALDIRVIIGNPPYSVGQNSANDGASNVDYPKLDNRIRETYAANSNVKKVRSLYDSYIRAIRWASDRIGESGVIGFVTNAGFVESNSASGLRKCLEKEFSSVLIFHLRGLRGKQSAGERARREGGQIFGSGSGAAIAITILVKNPEAKHRGVIGFLDIGDYLSREQKLDAIRKYGSVSGIKSDANFSWITPDEHGDWLRKRAGVFSQFIGLGDKKSGSSIFSNYCRGYETRRDAWAYNPSRNSLIENIEKMGATYNADRERIFAALEQIADPEKREEFINENITKNTKAISWTPNLLRDLTKNADFTPTAESIRSVIYRPFSKTLLMSHKQVIWSHYRLPSYFPSAASENRIIIIHGPGEQFEFTTLMASAPVDVHVLHGSQCFPRYVFDGKPEQGEGNTQAGLFTTEAAEGSRRFDGITDEGLRHFTGAYPGEPITKDDVFYYVYGLLHSQEYRERYADTLTKQLPRIPLVKRVQDFRAFVKAGRKLAELHVNFETVEPFPVTIKEGDLRLANIPDPVAYYRVEKMKFGGKRPSQDKTTVIYNARITITGIPVEAYDYVVNGKPALEWVMERQCVKADLASGIVNDANRFAIETMGDPAYPFKLFCRIITVSLETMKIIHNLPGLEIKDGATSTLEPETAAVEAGHQAQKQ